MEGLIAKIILGLRAVLFRYLMILTCILLLCESNFAQCNGQNIPPPGLTCSEAPVLCQVECLDGFTGVLPDTLIMPQPESLCNGGIPNNMSWFAFVAGSDSISLTITPANCTEVITVNDSTGVVIVSQGIQVGIYSSCAFGEDGIEVACALDGSNDPVDIGASTFVIGETYYLFVDGHNGSVCDYSVEVNFGEQAFEMPEITSFSNQYNIDFENDTICAGSEVFTSIDNWTVTADFQWTIDPPTPDYPTGVHPVTDSSGVIWQFAEAGVYDICVFAANFCDVSDTTCFTVMVDTLVDEYFSPIEVCQECYPIVLTDSDTSCIIGDMSLLLPTLLTEDPNDDGTVGWQGATPVMQAGSVVTVVPAEYGCTYSQYIDVGTIPISPREAVTLYRCPTDFPFTYHGETITGPVQNRFITIEGAAASRCDSLVSLTVETIGQASTIRIADCVAGGVVLVFDLNADLPPGAVISYEWLLGGSPVTDSDGVDSTLIATASGAYSISVTLTIDGVDCSFSRGGPAVDFDNLVPPQPLLGALPDSICSDGSLLQLYVENTMGTTYNWTLVPSLPFSEGATSDTIYVDVTGNNGFQYCVSASNDCGISDDTCQIMSVTSMPTGIIDGSAITCVDSTITVTYSGNANLSLATFDWNFGSATLLSSADVDGPGPHDIAYAAVGNYEVSVAIEQGLCVSDPLVLAIEVLSQGVAPLVECGSNMGDVTFQIVDLLSDMTYAYEVTAGTNTGATSSGNTIAVSGVPSGEDVTVTISYMTDCGTIVESYTCTAPDCPPADLDITILYPDGQCYSAPAAVDVSVTNAGTGITDGTWQGPVLPVDGTYTVEAAGTYSLEYLWIQDGCEYTVTDTIEYYSNPTLMAEVISNCTDTVAQVLLISDMPGTYMWEEEVVATANINNVVEGTYTASVVTFDGCSDVVMVDVALESSPSIDILGEVAVLENTEVQYELQAINVDLDSITWLLNGDVICQYVAACSSVIIAPLDGDELCAEYSDAQGCYAEDCITIRTYRESRVHMPNVFSPNGDGNNDFFAPVSNRADLPVLYLHIFDRWGNKVFTTANSTMGEDSIFWDGTYDGRRVDNGVYLYKLAYLDEAEPVTLVGEVTLLR